MGDRLDALTVLRSATAQSSLARCGSDRLVRAETSGILFFSAIHIRSCGSYPALSSGHLPCSSGFAEPAWGLQFPQKLGCFFGSIIIVPQLSWRTVLDTRYSPRRNWQREAVLNGKVASDGKIFFDGWIVASRVILLKMTISLLETHFPIPMNVARTLRLYRHERCSQCPIEYRRADNSVQISMHLYTFFASPSTIGNTIRTSKISFITFMVQCPWCFSQIMLMLFVPKPW